jgi:hypothetical protein
VRGYRIKCVPDGNVSRTGRLNYQVFFTVLNELGIRQIQEVTAAGGWRIRGNGLVAQIDR